MKKKGRVGERKADVRETKQRTNNSKKNSGEKAILLKKIYTEF